MLDHRIITFLTLYDVMNYRKTAEILNMTQPGVTQHIHYLESRYGVKLFEYNGRALRRTENADILKRHVDSIRAEELAMKTSFSTRDCISISVGATKTIGEFVISDIVERYLLRKDHTLMLHIDNTETLLRMLEESKLDFALIEGVFDKLKYGYRLFKKENFVGICSKNHPFANKTVSLEDTFNELIVVREKGSGTRRLLEQAVEDRGFSLNSYRRNASISSFSLICSLVADNNAITFAYEPIVHSRPDLALFEVEDMRIHGEFNFVYCNERLAEEKIRQFWGSTDFDAGILD